jgi:hypothetical protein
VHAKFQDIGDVRGVGCLVHALDKIDEVNRMATRLHQILFRYNKPITAISANANDPTGRPLPPPKIIDAHGTAIGESDTLNKGDDDWISLPGVSTINQLVPQLQYGEALAILQDMMGEIEKDLPELKYYQLSENSTNLSGKAVKLLLSDAIDKVIEVRGNAETALARADAMALTMGVNYGLFKDLGNYAAGDFEHSFTARPVIDPDAGDVAAAIQADVSAGMALSFAMKRNGFTDAEIAENQAALQAQANGQNTDLAALVLDAMRKRDQNNQGA